MSRAWTPRKCWKYASRGPTWSTSKADSSCRSRSIFAMNQMLIEDVAMFIPTIGHTPTRALKTIRLSEAQRLRIRNRSTRVWSSETMRSALPHQPNTSSQ